MSESALDLLSTSQTNRCVFGAPLVAIVKDGYATIQQACCNHWECPRCGQVRAREEYRRIVNGAEALEAAGHQLYFWTLTCRGKECSLEEAEKNYYAWTNKLLTNARAKCKRSAHYWAYVQITERQHKTREHPHSHILTTFCPEDAKATGGAGRGEHLVSAWFERANLRASLGSQHRISKVESAAAVSRYVAKYMFKASMTEKWPPKWKRVRYSENWPDLEHWTADWSSTLLTPQDWRSAAKQEVLWWAEDLYAYEKARHRMENVLRQDKPLIEQLQRDERIVFTSLTGE